MGDLFPAGIYTKTACRPPSSFVVDSTLPCLPTAYYYYYYYY